MAKTQNPPADSSATAATTPKPRKPRAKRPPRHVVLAEVTEDVNTKQEVYAIMQMPPLPSNKPARAALVRAATQKAVYEDGRNEYGNKKLVAIQVLDAWEVAFEERTALLPPQQS